ncbi:MAG TPA: RMD1 family protein [Saprospiraceae bacterium]|nr:RMD1 family protein [Saprospiraceae bacterium]
MKISAFYLAEGLSLRELKNAYTGHLIHGNASELFYRVDETRYFYAFDYGAVVFANMEDTDTSKNIAFLQPFLLRPLPEMLRENFDIREDAGAPLHFGFNTLTCPKLTEDVARIVMLTVAHSVSMDFYTRRAEELLAEINVFTNQMEHEGAIDISRSNMIRFIGRMLNSKNRIIENLFIFDSPELTWDDEYLDRIHQGLVRTFDIQSRFKEVEYTFKVIEDNLSVFRELYLHRESSKLEWIIIILICIEVADLLLSKLLKWF